MKSRLRSIAALVVVLGLLAVISLLSAPVTGDTSSRGASRAGTEALYDWVTKLGYPAQRMETTFAPASTATTLLVVAPVRDFTETELTTLSAWISNGGHAIVASNNAAVLGEIGQQYGVTGFDQTPAQTASVSGTLSSAAGPASTVALNGSDFLISAPEATPLLTVSGGSVGIDIRAGSGTLTLISDPLPLDNDGLRNADDAPFALALIERAPAGTVLFDDIHHQADTRDAQAVIFQSPLGLGLLIFIVTLLVFLFTTGRSLGRPMPRRDPGRVPTADDYVHAMTQLFARSDDAGAVAWRYHDSLKQRVAAMYGVDPRLDDPAFCTAMAVAAPAQAERLGELLGRSARYATSRPTPEALVALAQEIDAFERQAADPLAQ